MKSGQMKIGLEILSQIAIETKELMGKPRMIKVKEAFFDQKPQLFDLFRSLL
jgi:hypothetical protein